MGTFFRVDIICHSGSVTDGFFLHSKNIYAKQQHGKRKTGNNSVRRKQKLKDSSKVK